MTLAVLKRSRRPGLVPPRAASVEAPAKETGTLFPSILKPDYVVLMPLKRGRRWTLKEL